MPRNRFAPRRRGLSCKALCRLATASAFLPCSSRTNPRLKWASAKAEDDAITEANPAAASSSLPARIASVACRKRSLDDGVCADKVLQHASAIMHTAAHFKILDPGCKKTVFAFTEQSGDSQVISISNSK